MATYHFSLKNGKCGSGKNHAEYILRQGSYSAGSRAEELVHWNKNMPYWAETPSDFFQKADLFERANGRVYSEFEIALPNEVKLEDNIALVEKIVDEHIGQNKAWVYAIHSKQATFADEEEQIHAHIMFSERIVEDGMENARKAGLFFKRHNSQNPLKGGYKKDIRFSHDREVGKQELKRLRESLEEKINEMYRKNGIDKSVSCKKLSEQKAEAERIGDEALAEYFNRIPQEHLGPKLSYMTKKIIQKYGMDNENINDTLDKIYTLSPKAFCVVIDKIEKQKRAMRLENVRLIEAARSEREKVEKEIIAINEENRMFVAGTVLIDELQLVISRMQDQFVLRKTEIDKMKKLILSDKQINMMGISIYTKGKSKQLLKAKRINDRKLAMVISEIDEFLKKPEPRFYQLGEKREYQEEKIKLFEEKRLLEEKGVELINEMKILQTELMNPSNKKSLAKLVTKLRDRQNIRIQYIKDMTQELGRYAELAKLVVNIEYKLEPEAEYQVDKKIYKKLKHYGHSSKLDDISTALDDIKVALKDAARFRDYERPTGSNKLRVDLRDRNQQNQNDLGL